LCCLCCLCCLCDAWMMQVLDECVCKRHTCSSTGAAATCTSLPAPRHPIHGRHEGGVRRARDNQLRRPVLHHRCTEGR
jgi:hypothetical protein